MALWVNERLPGRGFLRLAYFTPTVLPMIAVANIWLFFYTPTYGLLEQIGTVFGLPSRNWLGDPATALAAITVVAVWKEAGFFMIFYLAALQGINPSLREAAAIEGAGRWFFFRRVLWPLLMPTTLFVGVNAVINAFRMVDHVVRDDARRARQRHRAAAVPPVRGGLQVLGPGLRLGHHGGAAGAAGQRGAAAVLRARPPHALPMTARTGAWNEPTWLDALGAWLLALLWFAPLAYAIWTAFHPTEYSARFTLTAPLTLDNFRNAWDAAPFARYFANTIVLVVMVLAAQLVLCTWPPMRLRAMSFRASRSCSPWCWCS
jgi:ABC-type sugar transport system permease subunit